MQRLSLIAISSMLILMPLLVSATDSDRFKTPEGFYVDPAVTYIYAASQSFYAVFERWPRNWAEVRSAGLVQVDLLNSYGHKVDPDATSWGGNEDIHYIFRGDTTPPTLMQFWVTSTGNGTKKRTPPITRPTYRELVNGFPSQIRAGLEGALNDKRRLQMFGLTRLLTEGVFLFEKMHHRVPTSWDELLNSGLAPIDADSANPYTGGKIYGDGRPNDFLYKALSRDKAKLLPTDEKGHTPWQLTFQ